MLEMISIPILVAKIPKSTHPSEMRQALGQCVPSSSSSRSVNCVIPSTCSNEYNARNKRRRFRITIRALESDLIRLAVTRSAPVNPFPFQVSKIDIILGCRVTSRGYIVNNRVENTFDLLDHNCRPRRGL